LRFFVSCTYCHDFVFSVALSRSACSVQYEEEGGGGGGGGGEVKPS
jgi:hypothetical protein